MPSIGKMAAQMTLESSQFTAGLQGAGRGINQFAANTKSAFDGVSQSAQMTEKSLRRLQEIGMGDDAGKGWKTKDVKNLVKAMTSANIVMHEFADTSSKAGKAVVDIFGTIALYSLNPYLGIAFGMKKAVDWITKGHEASEKLEAALNAAGQASQAIASANVFGQMKTNMDFLSAQQPVFAARLLYDRENNQLSRWFGGQFSNRIAAPDFSRDMRLAVQPFQGPDEQLRRMREQFDLQRRLVGLTGEMAQIYAQINEGASPQAVRLAAMALEARNVSQMLHAMRQQRDQAGLDPVQLAAMRVGDAGGTPADVRNAIAIARQIQRQTRDAQRQQEIARIDEQNTSPLERFQNEMARLNRLGLKDRQFNLAQMRAFDALESGLGKPGGISPTAAQMGSQGAANLIARSQNMASTQQDTLAILRESRELARRLVQRADELADRMRPASAVLVIEDEND